MVRCGLSLSVLLLPLLVQVLKGCGVGGEGGGAQARQTSAASGAKVRLPACLRVCACMPACLGPPHSSSSARRYSPRSAWWNTTIALGSGVCGVGGWVGGQRG